MKKIITKIIKIISNITLDLIIVFGLLFIILYFCGIRAYVVLSGSMEPSIKTGSISLVNTNYKYSDLKEKDIIAYKLNNIKVTHRIVKIEDGNITTKGDANEYNDEKIVTQDNYIGKNFYSIPKIGYVVKKIQTKTGIIISITTIALILLAGILLGDDKKKE